MTPRTWEAWAWREPTVGDYLAIVLQHTQPLYMPTGCTHNGKWVKVRFVEVED